VKKVFPKEHPVSPRVSQEILESITKREHMKTFRNDPDSIVDRIMGVKRMEQTYEKKDPIAEVQITHMRPLEDQLVELPRSAGGRSRSGGGKVTLEGVTADDLAALGEKQKVPNPSEVLRRYKTFSTEPQHPAEAEAVNLLNPDTATVGQTAPKYSAGSVLAQEFARSQSSGNFVTYAPGSGARRAGGEVRPGSASPRGSRGSLSHAISQNRMGSTQGMSGGPVRRGGSGLVVGCVEVFHDLLIPASLVVAKWGRLVNTVYGKEEGQPNRLAVEVQPLYLESLQADLETATGGRALFTCGDEKSRPSVFLLDIGTVNSAVNAHRPSGAPPEALELHSAGSYSVRVGGGTKTGGKGGGLESSSEEEYTETIPGINGAPDQTFVRRRRKKKLFRLGIADAVTALMTGREIMEDETRNRRRTRPQKPRPPPSEDLEVRAEMRLAVENAKARANKTLFELAREGDAVRIKTLLTQGIRANYEPNSLSQVKVELAELAELNRARNQNGEKPILSLEAYREHKELVARRGRMKAAATAAITGGGGGGESSPERAVSLFKPKPKEKAPEIDVIADVDAQNTAGNTPLIEAARRGHSEAVRVLLQHGANHKHRNNSSQTALDLAKVENGLAAMALASGLPGAPSRKRDAAKCLALLDDRSLLTAARDGDMRRVHHLVTREHNSVTAANEYGMTPLHFAVMRKDVPMIKFLCGEGGEVNLENNLGQSPWGLANVEPKKDMRERMLNAMSEGHELARAEADRVKVVAEEARRRAKQEAHLVRELKTITKGTAAARAVQLALSDTSENNFAKVKGVPSLGLDLVEKPRGRDVQSALDAVGARETPRVFASPIRGGSGAGMAAALALHAPKDFTEGIVTRSISKADKNSAANDLTQLSTAWSRHVLNWLGGAKKEAKLLDAKVRKEYMVAKRQEEKNKRLGFQKRVSGVGNESLSLHQDHADAELRLALQDPEMVDERKLIAAPPPDPSSQRFESWVKMRGLS